MNYDLTRLNNNIDKSIPINETYSFSPEELKGTDLLKLDNVRINGELIKNSLGNIELNVVVDGVMVLPCAITLKPVDYPFNIEISGELEELMEEFVNFSTNFQNSIDILPIIWENILMEIPSRVISPDADDMKTSGDGWKLIEDESKDENPELAKLKDLL